MDNATLTKTLCAIIGNLEGFTWDPDVDAYDPGTIGVYYGRIGDAPDRGVGVRVYNTIDEPGLRRRKVQIRSRGERRRPDGADVIADAVFARLDKLSREGGISGARRESMSDLGADDNACEQRTDNYTITLDNEEALQ